MADIFVGFYEKQLLSELMKPFGFNTFYLFSDQTEANKFFLLNNMHTMLKYTYAGEYNSTLAFLYVLLTKPQLNYLTSIYCKHIFTRL